MGLIGIVLALTTAISTATHNRQLRQIPYVSAVVVNCFKFGLAALVAATLITLTPLSTWSVPPWEFWVLVIISIPVEWSIAYLQTRAYQTADQSLIGPLSGLTPILLLPLGYVFLNEVPGLLGIIGVTVIFLGIILLGWNTHARSIINSLHTLLRTPGTIYMFSSILFSAAAFIIAKFAFTHGTPLLYVFYMTGFNALINTPYTTMIIMRKKERQHLRMQTKKILGATLSFSLLPSIHFIGLNLLPAAYFSALKRSSILMDVGAGKVFGKEKEWRQRFAAAALILFGIILFIFSST